MVKKIVAETGPPNDSAPASKSLLYLLASTYYLAAAIHLYIILQ